LPLEFIGDFGVLDSGRTDVAYEDWYGHKLDKKFLDLLGVQNKAPHGMRRIKPERYGN